MGLTVTLFLSITLILSYGIEILAKRIKVPSILLLLITGVFARIISDYTELDDGGNIEALVPIVGTLGLILIVFEGGLELHYERSKKKLIAKSFYVALTAFIITTVCIAFSLYLFSTASARICVINALPISIISSAIAIPAANFLKEKKREFIIYESVFSDIIGIVAFNYALKYAAFESNILYDVVSEFIGIIILCVLFCSTILIMLKHNKHPVKHVLILASLILVYSLGKVFHLPTLIIALVFGLTLKNFHLLNFKKIQKIFYYERYGEDLKSLMQITQEGVFVIKTFFFILLGYMIDLSLTITFINIATVMLILTIIYAVRWAVLRSWSKNIGSELYLAPRGLISILLFISIPVHLQLAFVSMEMLLLLILTNSLIIPFAFRDDKKIVLPNPLRMKKAAVLPITQPEESSQLATKDTEEDKTL